MKPRRFILQTGIGCMILVAYNFLIAALSRQMPAAKVIAQIQQLPTRSIVAYGNSTMAAALKEDTFARASGQPIVNLAVGATLPVDHLIMAKFAGAQASKPREVIYGFYGFQLFEGPTNAWRQFSGNRAVSIRLDAATAARFSAQNSTIDHLMIHLAAAWPALRERDVIWGKVEKWRRTLAECGLPKKAVNKFGRVDDFQKLLPLRPEDSAREFGRILGKKEPFCGPIEEMFGEIQKNGARLTVVAMPMHPAGLTEAIRPRWTEFMDYISARLARENIRFIDASAWIGDKALFDDPLHVNEKGSEIFSERLGREWSAAAPPPRGLQAKRKSAK